MWKNTCTILSNKSDYFVFLVGLIRILSPVKCIVLISPFQTSQFIADIGGTIGLWVGASMMTIFEFGEFFLDVFVLFLAKCFRCGKERSHEERQKYVSTQQTSAIGRNPVFDPETKWNCTSTLNRSRPDS